jgi:hypothetical protein
MMADPKPSVFDQSTLVATKNLVPDPGADNHVPITNGSAITTPNFLSGSQAGQEQVVISTGDQSILIDKTQNTTIKEKRVTEVWKDETYTNKEKYDRTVEGEYGHIVGNHELKLRVKDHSITITKEEIILSFDKDKRTITMNTDGIKLDINRHTSITMKQDGSICSTVEGIRSITINKVGILSEVQHECSISMNKDGIRSTVGEENFTRVHKGGVDTKGKLVKINDPGK